MAGLAIDLVATDAATLTHGHEMGYIPAAMLVHIVRLVSHSQGITLEEAVWDSVDAIQQLFPRSVHLPEFLEKIQLAVNLAKQGGNDLEAIHALGPGWYGDEALAVAIYCALKYQHDFDKALVAAINHGGDSDSTGAITGNILRAYLGLLRISKKYTQNLELLDVLTEIAEDLYYGCQINEYTVAEGPRDIAWEKNMRRSHTKELDGIEGGTPWQDGWLCCVFLIFFHQRRGMKYGRYHQTNIPWMCRWMVSNKSEGMYCNLHVLGGSIRADSRLDTGWLFSDWSKWNRSVPDDRWARCATVVMALGTAVFQLFPEAIISIFGSESALYQEFAVKSLKIFLLLIALNGFQLCTGVFFQAIGKPVQATLVSLSRQVLFLLPALVVLPRFLGVEGALWAGPVGDACAFVLALILGFLELRKTDSQPARS